MNKIFTKSFMKTKIFLITSLVHVAAVVFFNVTHFQLFFCSTAAPCDYVLYNKSAIEISEQFRLGNFLLKGITKMYPDIFITHIYPFLVAAIYTIFSPNIILGEIFNAFLCGLVCLLVYLVVIEIGGTEKGAFISGLIVSFYPSLILNGSLLLKDALEVCLSIAVLLMMIRLIKKFSFREFGFFCLLLIPTINLRFYLGYALMTTFIICWPVFCKNINLKKRIIYMVAIIFIFGFLPQISASNQGYWGITSVKYYLAPKTVKYYRETAYSNVGMSLNLKTDLAHPLNLVGNFSESFIYVLLGPLPWQIMHSRQLLVLFETIPWYFLLYFIVKGIIKSVKRKNFLISVPIVFSVIFLIVIAVFDSYYGYIMRIRMSAFISLLCIASLGIGDKNIVLNYISNKFEKIW
jgi:hypothetical protein